jgi:signal transduction histidine kinase
MSGDATAQLVVMLFISATASGAVPAFGSYLPATYAYTVPALLPFVLWSAARGDPLHQALALMGVVFSTVFLLLAHRVSANLIASLQLRFENLDLLEDLQRQKEIAEQANVAKSRFLAAASHDLRQPVHALGLFVGALRRRTMDDEARRLVQHLDGSVDALDSLFAALLDISRLDAGIVQSHLQAFAIQPMLDRVCADHAVEATAKGLRLVQHRSSVTVYSDPVLVERIVRNIVSNAVRYTDKGRVLVGCRRGARLSIEVWDTGRGISREQQERVFEEFYQIDNPERDRAKGLGLGLAIVKRLSSLLGCPLTLASAPGKGSVFKLAVPLFDGTMAEEAASSDAAPLLPSAGLILVIDDEVAIQDAMRSLLTEWGEVIVAGSCEEMLARVADRQTRAARRARDRFCGAKLRQALPAYHRSGVQAAVLHVPGRRARRRGRQHGARRGRQRLRRGPFWVGFAGEMPKTRCFSLRSSSDCKPPRKSTSSATARPVPAAPDRARARPVPCRSHAPPRPTRRARAARRRPTRSCGQKLRQVSGAWCEHAAHTRLQSPAPCPQCPDRGKKPTRNAWRPLARCTASAFVGLHPAAWLDGRRCDGGLHAAQRPDRCRDATYRRIGDATGLGLCVSVSTSFTSCTSGCMCGAARARRGHALRAPAAGVPQRHSRTLSVATDRSRQHSTPRVRSRRPPAARHSFAAGEVVAADADRR